MNKIRVITTFKLKNNNDKYASYYLKEFAANSITEPGCLNFEFLCSQEMKDQYTFLELWENESAAHEHTQSENFKEFAIFFSNHLKEFDVKKMVNA